MDILNDVLDLSKVESGSSEVESADFQLRDLLSSLEAMFRPQASSKGVQLEFANDVPPMPLRGDPARLRQILLNLVGNAIKFTEAGQVSLTASFRARTPQTGKLALVVADSGIGIAPAAIERIFQPFVQADSSTTRRFGGTGLGLAITRRLVELLGGKITVESRLGVGTTFRVELPIQRSEATEVPREAAPVRPEPLPDLSAGGHRVLLAEDNATNQFMMTRFLDRLGLASDCAANGREALLLWEKQAYDMILMDVEMPILDGLEAARENPSPRGRPRPGAHPDRRPLRRDLRRRRPRRDRSRHGQLRHQADQHRPPRRRHPRDPRRLPPRLSPTLPGKRSGPDPPLRQKSIGSGGLQR